jgi:hypothetical protein
MECLAEAAGLAVRTFRWLRGGRAGPTFHRLAAMRALGRGREGPRCLVRTRGQEGRGRDLRGFLSDERGEEAVKGQRRSSGRFLKSRTEMRVRAWEIDQRKERDEVIDRNGCFVLEGGLEVPFQGQEPSFIRQHGGSLVAERD